MPSLAARAIREVYRREALPATARWGLAALGMRDFFRIVGKGLEPHLGERRHEVLSELGAEMMRRRYEVLRGEHAHLPSPDDEPRAIPILMSALYATWSAPKSGRIFRALGGPARGLSEHRRARRLITPLSHEARWLEVTVHLGELLIVMTEKLPDHMPHARKVLADICFEMGARYAKRVARLFALPANGSAPEHAIEVLRMSEYVFRVNPEHWSETDAAANTGYLEGNACPWWDRPGWHGGHCGIFGQFQSGIASVFGLRYRLTKTIPKHGGDTCRIDLIPLKKRPSPS